jgi:hypothetical protein
MLGLMPHLPDFLARHPNNLLGERAAVAEYEIALAAYRLAQGRRLQELAALHHEGFVTLVYFGA